MPFNIDSQGLTLQKCIPKADMENITIKCSPGEIIAIQAAFFTSSGVDQCPFSLPARSNNDQPNNVTSNEIDDDDHRQFYNGKRSCTDDLRMTLNSRYEIVTMTQDNRLQFIDCIYSFIDVLDVKNVRSMFVRSIFINVMDLMVGSA